MMAKHYSTDEKQELLHQYHMARRAGKTARAAAKELGVTYMTMRRWELASGDGPGPHERHSSMPPRAVSPVEAPPVKLSLTTPNGYRIEAQDPEDIIKVLRALR